jgi:isoleucyl-tRNA synthetase
MPNYKDTLNLPKTAFSMKAKLTHQEPQRIDDWHKKDIYQVIRQQCKGRSKFILHDGPPYANGNIHIGHAVNIILKDFIVKAKTLSGFDAPLIPGWDCHGLPIEHKVEELVGKEFKKSNKKKFKEECRLYAQKQVEKQKQGFVRLGVFADWDNPYLTSDFKVEADIIRSLNKIISNGHLARGYKPVYWNVVGESALSEAEVEYKDKKSCQIDVQYPLANPEMLLKKIKYDKQKINSISIVIWTTTPWTLPASQAVSVHPELEYAIVQCHVNDVTKNLIIAKDLVESSLNRYDINDYSVLTYFKGSDLEDLEVIHPLYNKKLPIFLGDHVTSESGTGSVHTAPAHGVDDFNVAKKYNVSPINVIKDNGVYKDDVKFFAGEHIYKVENKIIDKLQEVNRLLASSFFTHSYPHCWRTKAPLIYRATPQWFISMSQEKLLDTSLSAIDKVEFIPPWGKNRLSATLSQSPDWCISRQRVWGVPIPLFINKNTEKLHPNTSDIIEKVAELVETNGIDAWDDLDITAVLPEKDIENYTKVTDTLDVWFDSGVTHSTVVAKNKNLQFPADLYLEGSDQHRGWFQSSLKTSIAMNKVAPYKSILTHGFVVDGNGRKMSKSLGNVIDPQKVVDTFGADILRLWVSSVDYTKEIAVSNDSFVKTSDIYRRIRNTSRFLLANIAGFDPEEHLIATKNMLAIDQWIINKTALLQEELIELYNSYNFPYVFKKIHEFCSIYLGSFYLDIIKDRQYTTSKDSLARRSCQTAMYHVLEALTRWLAPIISFTAEEIWQAIPGNRSHSVFFETWYQLPIVKSSLSQDNFWEQVIDVKTRVNKAIEASRANGTIGSSLEAEIELYADPSIYSTLNTLAEELQFILITSKATLDYLDNAPNDAITTDDELLKIVINKSSHSKCERCWHRAEDINSNEDHPDICVRCVGNITGNDEVRKFA